MDNPYWLSTYARSRNSIRVEAGSDNTSLLKYTGALEIGEGSLHIKLGACLDLVNKNLSNSLVIESLLSYLCTHDSFLAWNQHVLIKEVQAELAISTLVNVMSYVLDLGSDLDLREVCKCITFLSDYMLEIEYMES